MKKKKWIIHGLEGCSHDFGFCEPYTAAEAIRYLQASGEELNKEDIERIARNFGCWVEWI